ncbi:hypothetical protein ACS0TY_007661 [Phlomoides rotata]
MDQLRQLTYEPAAETRNPADVLGTSGVKRGKTKKSSKVSFEKANTTPKPLLPAFNTVPTWAVQCKECRKWRVIPTQEEYEELRKKIVEDPFACKRKDNVSCNDPDDLKWDTRSIWVMDKPNLPKSPAGFKRKLTMRNNMNRLDCYYETPTGRKLRGPSEVASFLSAHREFKDVSLVDFDFRAPKIAKSITPLAG